MKSLTSVPGMRAAQRAVDGFGLTPGREVAPDRTNENYPFLPAGGYSRRPVFCYNGSVGVCIAAPHTGGFFLRDRRMEFGKPCRIF